MRHYSFLGTDGNGGFIDGVTNKKYGSMKLAMDEIEKRVHSVIECKAI